MRPDCSLLIQAEGDGGQTFEPLWLHFDAKYRVENVAALFGAAPQSADDEGAFLDQEQLAGSTGAKRADLLKMHAYRDAIRRSAGAFVIYPGTETERCAEYHELLPGLGAFALRPTAFGAAEGVESLRQFMDDVLDHVASQGSQHERGRYWLREVHREQSRVAGPVRSAAFLRQPPADTLVLLGYVRNRTQRAWILAQGLYNLRADGRGSVGLVSRELAAELVLLWSDDGAIGLWQVVGEPLLKTRSALLASGYKRPTVDLYFCLPVRPVPGNPLPAGLDRSVIEGVRRRGKPGVLPGAPVAVTWLDLLQACERRP